MDTNQYIILCIVLIIGIAIGVTSVNTFNSPNSGINQDNKVSTDMNGTNNAGDGNYTSQQKPIVVDVSDGDTVDVKYPDGSVETVRIFGIDTPEKSTDLSGTSEFGVQSTAAGTACLERYSNQSTSFAEEKLLDKKVQVLTTSGENRGDFGRQLRYVVPVGENRSYGEMVLSEGLARVYDNKGAFDKVSEYNSIEKESKTERKGLWNCSAGNSDLAITEVRSDALSSDTENPTEFVEITNVGSEKIDIGELRISDDANNSFRLRNETLHPGSITQIHTCDVSEYRSDYSVVLDYCSGLWNNDGDTVRILSPETNIRLRYE